MMLSAYLIPYASDMLGDLSSLYANWRTAASCGVLLVLLAVTATVVSAATRNRSTRRDLDGKAEVQDLRQRR